MTTKIVIVDENVADGSPLRKQFQQAMTGHKCRYVLLREVHRGIPDIEILDKLLHQGTILLTGDRVLHRQAIERGFRSYTLNEHGQLTRRRRRDVRPPKPMPLSTEKVLHSDYHHQQQTEVVGRLKALLTDRQLKRYRTTRRRIRSHFGSAQSIASAAICIGARVTERGILCGFSLHLAGNSGVKGLRASEGYGLVAQMETNPSCPIIHALRDLYFLQLEHLRVDLFVIPPDSLELARGLVGATTAPNDPVQTVLHELLVGMDSLVLHPCVKGRFFEAMERKFDQLLRSGSNEITRFECARLY